VNPLLQPGETVQEDDPRIVYSAGWIRNDQPIQSGFFRGGALRYTTSQGATASIPSSGVQIQFGTYTKAGSGIFELLYNGAIIAAYNLYSATPTLVTITSPVVVPAGNKTFVVRKRDADTKNIYLDEVAVLLDGSATPSPSLTAPPTATAVVLEEDNAAFTSGGGWASGNSSIYSAGKGKYAPVSSNPYYELTRFAGGSLTISSLYNNLGGSVDVLVGGVIKDTFSQYDPNDNTGHLVDYVLDNLPGGCYECSQVLAGPGSISFGIAYAAC
jgi:hypothetical protein